MAAIPPIITFMGLAEWPQLRIVRAELGAPERRSVLASLVTEFEILLVLEKPFFCFVMKMAWKNGRHFTNIHPFWRERVNLSL
jgi:hypothetical protein